QGFESPQLHHLLIRTSHAPAPRHLRAAGTAVPVALARHRRLTPVGRCKLKTVGVYSRRLWSARKKPNVAVRQLSAHGAGLLCRTLEDASRVVFGKELERAGWFN